MLEMALTFRFLFLLISRKRSSIERNARRFSQFYDDDDDEK